MSSYVPNIGSVKPFDARLERRRRDYQSRQNSEQKSDDDILDQDHRPILSVQALILFLEDFLESRLGSKLRDAPEVKPNSFDRWFKKKPGNCNFAARAYQQGAKTARGAGGHVDVSVGSHETDLSHIYGLIRDLRALKISGVHVLRLESDTDFIDGISMAVLRARELL